MGRNKGIIISVGRNIKLTMVSEKIFIKQFESLHFSTEIIHGKTSWKWGPAYCCLDTMVIYVSNFTSL